MITSSNGAYAAGMAATEKKAFDIRILNVAQLGTITDYFVLCSGNSVTQVKAITDEIEEKLQLKGMTPSHKEGYATARWILMDYGDFIVHVFHKEDREFYDLERYWNDAEAISI